MRYALLILLAAQTALGFTDVIWQNPPALYTNALGMELVGETVLRSRWAGDTNWNYLQQVYAYTGLVSVVTTNPYADIYVTDNGYSDPATWGIYIMGYYYFHKAGDYSHIINEGFLSKVWPSSPKYAYPSGEGVNGWPGSVRYDQPALYVTNYYPCNVTNTATNVFGSIYCGDVVTSAVPFKALEADKITAQLEVVLPAYVLPCYSSDPDYSFDGWFSNRLDRWPGGSYPKENLFYHTGTNLGIITTGIGSNIVIDVFHNTYDEIAGWPHYTNDVDGNPVLERIDVPVAHWIKWRDRYNPLIVAEWRRYNRAPSSSPGEETAYAGLTNEWEFYKGWGNEFTDESTTLYGITPAQYPSYVVRLGGSNAYSGGLSLELSDDLMTSDVTGPIPAYGWYIDSGFGSPFYGEWTNNQYIAHDSLISGWPTWENSWSNSPIAISSATQRSDRAWLALGAPLHLVGTPPNVGHRTNITSDITGGVTNITTNVVTYSGDSVSLQYIDKMTTYEGTKVWDNNLFPEQLTAHYIAMTNMFLTPWAFSWTNTTFYSNAQNSVYTPDATTSQSGTNTGTSPLEPINVVDDWVNNCPAIDPIPLVIDAEPYYSIAVDNHAPQFNFSMYASLEFQETYIASAALPSPNVNTNCYIDFPLVDWTWVAESHSRSYANLQGVSYGSYVFIGGLYTGTLHRAHIYANYTDNDWITNTPMHRIEITDWTTDSTIISTTEIKPWAGIDGGVLTAPCDYVDGVVVRDCGSETCYWYERDAQSWTGSLTNNTCVPILSATTNITFNNYTIDCTFPDVQTTNYDITFTVTGSSNISVAGVSPSGYYGVRENICSGVMSSQWDGVSWQEISRVSGSNEIAAATNETLEIWTDGPCGDPRTNVFRSFTPYYLCDNTVDYRIPEGATETSPGAWEFPLFEIPAYFRSWLMGGSFRESMTNHATYNRSGTIGANVKVLIEWAK
jgi:hypothetical protein